MTMRVSFVFLALFPLFKVACYAHLHRKRDDLLIRKRNKSAIILASSAGWLAYFTLVVSVFGGVPCLAVYIASLLVAPMSVGPQIVRALTLRGKLKHSQLVIEEEISTRAERSKGQQLSTIQSSESKHGDASASPNQITRVMEANLVMTKTKKMVERTKWALIVVPGALLVLSLALSSDATQLLATDFELCQPEPTYFQYASPTFGVASTALALAVSILVKQIDDELGLRTEIQRNAVLLGCTYLLIIIVRLVGYHDWQPLLQTIQQMMLFFSMAIAPFLSESTINLMTSWAKKQGNRINPATKSAVPGYARSLPHNHRGSTRLSIQNVMGRQSMTAAHNDQRGNHEVEVSWNAGLCILLSTEDGINLFSQHCAREFSSENVRFWCAVNDYRAKFDEESCIPSSSEAGDETVDDEKVVDEGDKNIDMKGVAQEIYDQFVSLSSKTQINVSSDQKSEIEKALSVGEVKKELFDAAQREIFKVMSRDSYPRFLASKNNRLQT